VEEILTFILWQAGRQTDRRTDGLIRLFAALHCRIENDGNEGTNSHHV